MEGNDTAGATALATEPTTAIARLAHILGMSEEKAKSAARTYDWTLDKERDAWQVHLPVGDSASKGLLRWTAAGALDFTLLPDPMADVVDHLPVAATYGLRLTHERREAYLVPSVLDTLVMLITGRRGFALTPEASTDALDGVVDDILAAKLATVVVIGTAGPRGLAESTALATMLAHHPRLKPTQVQVRHFRWTDDTPIGLTLTQAWVELQRNGADFDALLNAWLQCGIPQVAPLGGAFVPQDAAFITPEGYLSGHDGVARITLDRKLKAQTNVVCPHPLWLGGTYSGASDGGDVSVQLCAKVAGRTIKRVVSLGELASGSKIPALAADGFVGCTSVYAEEIVRYITAAYLANVAHLPKVSTVTHVGTEGAGPHEEPTSFVFSGTRYTADGVCESVEMSRSAGVPAAQWKALGLEGSASEWVKILAAYKQHRFETPYLMLVATVASLLNRPLGVMPITVQAAGEAAKGKTMALKLAQSAQGSPRAVESMRNTLYAIELMLGFHNDVALPLDELQSMGRGRDQDSVLEDFVYMVTEGVSRGRGSKDAGMRDKKKWTCNVIVTGERDLATVSSTGNTGSKRRVISVFGLPFGETRDDTRTLLRDLTSIAMENHGHAIDRVGRFLVDATPDWWKLMRLKHQQISDRYVEECPETVDRGIAGGFSSPFAALGLAGELLDELFKEELKPYGELPTAHGMLAAIWRSTMERMAVSSRAVRGIDVLKAYFAQHIADFDGISQGDASVDVTRSNQRLGTVTDRYVAFLQGPLGDYLKKYNMTLETEISHWHQNGWVVLSKEGWKTRSVKVNKAQTRCLCIRRDIMDAEDPEACHEPEYAANVKL